MESGEIQSVVGKHNSKVELKYIPVHYQWTSLHKNVDMQN